MKRSGNFIWLLLLSATAVFMAGYLAGRKDTNGFKGFWQNLLKKCKETF